MHTRRWSRPITPPWQGSVASLAILRRELVVTLRGGRSAILVTLTCALATYLLLQFWPPDGTDLREIGKAPARILLAVSLVLLGASYIALPGLAANAILAERQQQTFDTLKLTLIPPFWVVFAKLMNCAGFFLLLLVAAVPILAASFFLLGIDIQQFVAIVALLFMHALACSAAGLAASAFARRPLTAIALSYMLVALISGLPTAIANESMKVFDDEFAIITCPVAAITSILDNDIDLAEFYAALPIQLGLFLFIFAIAIYFVRRPERVVQEEQVQLVDDAAQLAARRKQFPFYLIDPLRRRPNIPDGKNPMRIKELRWGLLGRESRMIRICYATATLMFFFSIFSAEHVEWWVVAQFVIVLMFAPAFVASAVSKEFEQGNMDLLRLTLLDGRALMQGKFWAATLSLSPLLIGLLLGGIPMIIYHFLYTRDGSHNRTTIILQFYPMLLTFILLVLAFGMFFSVVYRRTVSATVTSYAILGLIVFAVPAFIRIMPLVIYESTERIAFFTPLGFVTPFPDPWTRGFILSDGGKIALQWCILVSMALIAFRAAEILFIRKRMQDR